MRNEIANRLKKYREAAGMSLDEVANRLGVDAGLISNWESGEVSPDIENTISLAQLYGVTVDEILFVDPELDGAGDGVKAIEIAEVNEGAGASEEKDGSESCGCASGYTPNNANGNGDYVDISLENGVHVRDSKKGEEVHVGWDGIHIDTADNEHVHINFGDFKDIASAIRELRKSQR